MRKILIALICMVLVLQVVSAQTTIIITKQPKDVYSLGDAFSVPTTIKTLSAATGVFEMSLICNGQETNFYRNGITLPAGGEQRENPLLVLTDDIIGITSGTCSIKAQFGTEYVLTEEFTLSSLINLELTSGEGSFNPGEEVLVQGHATKENGEPVNGFIELDIIQGNSSSSNYLETISNGFFSITLPLDETMPAGKYLISLNAYEIDSLGQKTNTGFLDYNMEVNQVPTSLELVFETTQVLPGTDVKVKTVLWDQSGVGIEGVSSIITLKDITGKILEQQEKATGEELEYEVQYNEPPTNWSAYAVSSQLNAEAVFEIIANPSVKINLNNKSLIVTNDGNVYYNDTILVRIGDEAKPVDVSLAVDESKKFTLTAPDGEYEVEVMEDGESKITGMVSLTGRAVEVKESGGSEIIRHPLVWVFIIAILGFVAFIVFKKGYNKTFVGYIKEKKFLHHGKKKDKDSDKVAEHESKPITDSKKKANLSLSLKGSKQDSTFVCLKIKNPGEVSAKTGGTKETIEKITQLAEDRKAVLYESGDCLFFIFAPSMTRTFNNEKPAIKLAHDIKGIIDEHNNLFQQKIDFGIAMNHGQIVAKKEDDSMKFMSLGSLVSEAKKAAMHSTGEVLLSKDMNDKLRTTGGVKTEKKTVKGHDFHIVSKIRELEKQGAKFIGDFVKRLEGEKKK